MDNEDLMQIQNTEEVLQNAELTVQDDTIYQNCVQLDQNNQVINIIVCSNINWAIQNLDGRWIPLYKNQYCSLTSIYDQQHNTFIQQNNDLMQQDNNFTQEIMDDQLNNG